MGNQCEKDKNKFVDTYFEISLKRKRGDMKLEEMQLRALEKRMTVSANKAAQDPKATKEKKREKN